MRKFVIGSALAFIASVGLARAEIGTVDVVPGATLLLPYFEVDLARTDGVTTLISINNASASAAVAHVTLWTDQSVPTFNFDVYLTGYDTYPLNLRDVFNGAIPQTADAGADTGDTFNNPDGISNKGPLSQDINFPACEILPPAPISAAIRTRLRSAHTGVAVADFGGECAGANHGDQIARGYITVDSVTTCNNLFPSDAGYFSGGIADNRNILWGDYLYVNPSRASSAGNPLVHVESCIPGSSTPIINVGNGAGKCPFAPGQYTFYGRYTSLAGQDQREPLATTFTGRFVNSGLFAAGTDVIVWRDAKTLPVGATGTHSCTVPGPSWYPLAQADVVAFDEQENATDLCASEACFPLEAGRYDTRTGSRVSDLSVPSAAGFLYLNLNHATGGAGGPLPAATAQSWVTTQMDGGNFSVGYHATPLDSATTIDVSGGRILIP